MITALEILNSEHNGVQTTPAKPNEGEKPSEQNMNLQISNMYTLFNVPPKEKTKFVNVGQL